MPGDPDGADATVDALLTALRLKDVDRAGWVRKGVTRPESVAAHSWGLSLLVLTLAPPHLDRGLALAYAALHDLAEVRVGDLTPHDGVPPAEKHRREADAITGMTAGLPPHIAALWHAYEAQADEAARFVRQLDRLDMALQATVYARRGEHGMDEFVASARRGIDDPGLLALLDRLDRRI